MPGCGIPHGTDGCIVADNDALGALHLLSKRATAGDMTTLAGGATTVEDLNGDVLEADTDRVAGGTCKLLLANGSAKTTRCSPATCGGCGAKALEAGT
mmetsp:Transcript_26506/g.58396  ORF Transcript_26506/g.58396 Transcript_26506/m.58396 type:complete len:98 (-) Transcript_26506:1142-1435(-)